MDANKKWLSIPKEIRNKLRENVFCGHCKDVVTIDNFTIEDHQFGIVLKGKCQKCGHDVVRVVED
ncbi:hypothetical protein [Sutcliffiella rhizosphaerae]|uniref:Uncharacterized protein n=1 Tax=Sutcliffiella rhizosphaerae TaxID=2880967 RepID=A0ABM8YK98_9BACI|nr:hypothetical protein [Sutcliffiella rhizosphaerae]CAG9620369.1 hypothetical protein BACCIP111883_01137 [Sutcliffiella rhizosphaerae]